MIKDLDLIREVQKANYRALQKLDEICKKYDIQYWIAYGSLIGTIRHKGFVPWDDDLDVCMMREDYEKLCKVPKEEWGEDCLFLSGYDDDLRQDKVFGRIFQKNTVVQSRIDVERWKNPTTGKAFSSSMMCDIFIFERVPDDEKKRKKIYNKVLYGYCRKYKLVKYEYIKKADSPVGKLKVLLQRAYGKWMRLIFKKPWVRFVKKFDKLAKNCQQGKRIGTFSCADPYTYNYDDVFPLIEKPFEDMMVPVPRCYEQMLTDMYGDYMKFPPEDQRYHLDFVYVDFGDGRKYVFDPIKGSIGEGNE